MKKFFLLFALLFTVSSGPFNCHALVIDQHPEWSLSLDVHPDLHIPSYSFYLRSAPQDVYQLNFYEIFEEDKDSKFIENSTLPFSRQNWTLSERTRTVLINDVQTETVIFQITTGESDRFKSLKLINTLSLNETSTLDCSVILSIEHYRWFSDSSDNLLLKVSLSRNNDSMEPILSAKSLVKLSKSFFKSPRSALLAPDAKVPVFLTKISESENQQKFAVVFERFSGLGTLVYEPVFGLGNPDAPTVQKIILMTVCVTVVAGLMILGLVATYVIKRRKREYMLLVQESQ